MEQTRTIVLVLRSGGDFSFKDVELIARHINGKWQSADRPRIVCLWDQASMEYDLGNIHIIPLTTELPGTWSRIQLYSPEMEKYRPFLYIDLDTAVIRSLENIFTLVVNQKQFITLEDFWDTGQLATGLVWVPADSKKVDAIWKHRHTMGSGKRMDRLLRKIVKADGYWQHLTKTIHDFKPKNKVLLDRLPENANLVCFHGKPRIFEATSINWIETYVLMDYRALKYNRRVTVIIPYNIDRGWLKEAINSVPEGVQLLVSQGEGNWPENFNKVLDQAKGKYIRWLHEDDMLTPNSIEDSVRAIEEQGVDFIHGQATEIFMNAGRATQRYIPPVKYPTVEDMLRKNVIHSATLLYHREVFEKVGKMDETLNTAEEFEFNLRCLKAGLKIGYCESTLAFYRRHPLQKVRVVQKAAKIAEREMVKKLYA